MSRDGVRHSTESSEVNEACDVCILLTTKCPYSHRCCRDTSAMMDYKHDCGLGSSNGARVAEIFANFVSISRFVVLRYVAYRKFIMQLFKSVSHGLV